MVGGDVGWFFIGNWALYVLYLSRLSLIPNPALSVLLLSRPPVSVFRSRACGNGELLRSTLRSGRAELSIMYVCQLLPPSRTGYLKH